MNAPIVIRFVPTGGGVPIYRGRDCVITAGDVVVDGIRSVRIDLDSSGPALITFEAWARIEGDEWTPQAEPTP